MAGYRTESLESAPWAAGVVDRALALRGIPYRLGGERPETGLDCSGLVRYVFAGAGLELARTVREQFMAGRRVDTRSIRAGDLIFFDITDPGPSHVGIAIDAETFVHAPGSGGVVRVDRLAAPYWQRHIRGVRRVAVDDPRRP
jgi:cell wall-associated NlpC family hydrolase